MVMPKFIKILNKGLISAIVVSALSFFIPLVPCTKAPVIANPEYSFAICKLPNPFGEPLLGISQKFYNVSTEPLAGLILQFILATIIITAILVILKRKKGKIVDLTNKRE